MKRFLIIFVFLIIILNGFSQSYSNPVADELLHRRDKLIEYEEIIGKDTVFYLHLDTFKLKLDNYLHKFGADKVYHNVSDYWGKKYSSIDPFASIEFFKNNITYAKKDNNKKAIALNQHELAKLYFNLQQMDYAISSYIETSKMFEELEDWHAYAYSIIDIANVYYYHEQFEIAISHYDKAFKIMKEKLPKDDFYYGAALCYINKGSINDRQKNHKEALTNYKIALDYKKKNKREKQYSSIYHHIAKVFENMNSNDSAIYYYTLAVNIDEKYNLIDELFLSYKRFGDFYMKKNKFKESKELFIKAYYLAKRNDKTLKYSNVCVSIGKLFADNKMPDSAIFYLEKAYEITLKNDIPLFNRNVSYLLHSIYSEMNNTEMQLKYLKRIFEYENQSNLDDVSKLQIKYEFKERLKERESAEYKIKRLRFFFWGIFIVSFLLAAFASIFIWQRQQLRKTNIQIKEKSKKTESQSKKLKEANIELKKRDEFKEDLTGVIVNDLRNPANSILHLSELIDKKDDIQIMVKTSANQILNLVHNILDVQKYENIEMPIELNKCSIREIAENAIKQDEFLANEKNIKIKNNIPQDIILSIDCEKIGRVFTNLLTNAIKFTASEGCISFGFINKNNKKHFFVKDNGHGIEKSLHAAIFNKFSQVVAKKSGKALSTGLGLTYCKLAIETHGGEIWVESEVGKGSTFFFTLP